MGRQRSILPPLAVAALLAWLLLARGAVGTGFRTRRRKSPQTGDGEARRGEWSAKYEHVDGIPQWMQKGRDSKPGKGVEAAEGGDPMAAGILGTLSQEGLEYVKEVLVGEILAEITPLQIADIRSRVSSPIGSVDALVSDITLMSADVLYSEFDLGERGVLIYGVGITAALSMRWEYHYSASYVPWPLGDGGRAKVAVRGMQAGVSFDLLESNGTLRLAVDEAGALIESLDIELAGGASWLYQWFVYAFDSEIRAAIEDRLTLQIIDGAEGLDKWLLTLPRAIPIDDTSALDVTVVQDPLLNPSYLSVGAKGQFVPATAAAGAGPAYPEPETQLPAGLFCEDGELKMVTIAFSEYVLNSAAFVYYDGGALVWDVDSSAGNKYLNTGSWKYIIPQLYWKYPNADMVINFAVSSPPAVAITAAGVRAEAGADMTVEVKDGADGAVVPVACINLMASFDAVAKLIDANVTGEATLEDITVSLKWSNVGDFHTLLLQTAIRAIMKDVVMPLINLSLKRGFPIPIVAGVRIEDADLRYGDGYLLVCTDVRYEGGFFQTLQPKKLQPNESIFELHARQ